MRRAFNIGVSFDKIFQVLLPFQGLGVIDNVPDDHGSTSPDGIQRFFGQIVQLRELNLRNILQCTVRIEVLFTQEQKETHIGSAACDSLCDTSHFLEDLSPCLCRALLEVRIRANNLALDLQEMLRRWFVHRLHRV